MGKFYSLLYNLGDLGKKIRKIMLVSKMILKNEITYYPDIVKNFEKDFAIYHGRKYALTFCNGTNAIEAAMFAIGIKEGDEVIVPSCTFHATIDPAKNFGANIVFVDTEKDSVLISIDDLKEKLQIERKLLL